MSDERVRVLRLSARDVKLVREVEIDLDGEMHEIRGDAGQGKTTILQIIEAGLRGLDPDMVRKGATAAEIELTLSSARIQRITPADGAKEKVLITDADGNPIERATEFLRAICGPSAFRPIEFVQLGGGERKGKTERLRLQREQLLQALDIEMTKDDMRKAVKALGSDHASAMRDVNLDGVDLNQHPFIVCAAIERACYDTRKLLNAKADDAESALKHVPPPAKAPPGADLATCESRETIAAERYHEAKAQTGGRSALMERGKTVRNALEAERDLPARDMVEKTRGKYEGLRNDLTSEIAALEEQLEKARARLKDTRDKLAKCDEYDRQIDAHEAHERELSEIEGELAKVGEVADVDALKRAWDEAREDTTNRRAQDRHEEAAHTAAETRAKALLYDDLVRLFRDDLPKELLSRANLPVDGLSVDEEKILIRGVPLHQLGTSEQIRIGVAIAAALNPRSGFVLVDGAESLGREDRRALAQSAKEMGLQLILTYVDPDAVPSENVTVMRNGAAIEAA